MNIPEVLFWFFGVIQMNSLSNKKSKIGTQIRNVTYSALCLALALVLPFLTGQIPEVGQFISPMHIPAFLCGLICGPFWGIVVGAVSPLLRFLIFSMPGLLTAIPMAFELAAYAGLSAWMYRLLEPVMKKMSIYISLVIAMIGGRIIYTLAKIVTLGIAGKAVEQSAYFVVFLESFTGTWLGIVIQLLLIPPLVLVAEKYLQKNK